MTIRDICELADELRPHGYVCEQLFILSPECSPNQKSETAQAYVERKKLEDATKRFNEWEKRTFATSGTGPSKPPSTTGKDGGTAKRDGTKRTVGVSASSTMKRSIELANELSSRDILACQVCPRTPNRRTMLCDEHFIRFLKF